MKTAKNIIIVDQENSEFSIYLQKKLQAEGWRVFLLNTHKMAYKKIFCHLGQNNDHIEIGVEDGVLISGDSIALLLILSMDQWSRDSVGEEGMDYESLAWVAFWLYGHRAIGSVVNRVSHPMLSVSSLCLPRVYQVMSSVGIEVPKWRFDSRGYTQTSHEFQNDIWNSGDFRSKKSGDFRVERLAGDWVVCLYVLGKLFIKNAKKEGVIAMPKSIGKKVKKLCETLTLDIAEVLLLKTDEKWKGYGISVQPDFDKRWKSQWRKIADVLSREVEKNHNALQTPMQHDCFIRKKDLPLVQA